MRSSPSTKSAVQRYLVAAVRYVALNPVRARLVACAQDWPWSSVRAHLAGRNDDLVTVAPILSRVSDFAALVAPQAEDKRTFAIVRAAEGTERPLGNAEFIEGLDLVGDQQAQRHGEERSRRHAHDPTRPPRPGAQAPAPKR